MRFKAGTSPVGPWVRIKNYFLNKTKAEQFLELDEEARELICDLFDCPEILFGRNSLYSLLKEQGWLINLKLDGFAEQFYALNPLVIEQKFKR